jgi:hypothetical protein
MAGNPSEREEAIRRGGSDQSGHERNPARFQLSGFGRATLLAASCSNRCAPARKARACEPERPDLLVKSHVLHETRERIEWILSS